MTPFKNRLANLISYLLHPVFMPSYAVYLILQNSVFKPQQKLLWLVYAVVFLNTCLLPVLITLFLKKSGLVSNLNLNQQSERTRPYFISFAFFLSTWWLLLKAPLPGIIAQLMLGAAMALFFTGFINLKMKISAHLVGIGGITGAFLALNVYDLKDTSIWIMVCFIVAGIIAWARLQLNAHSPKEVYTGFGLGVFCQLLAGFIMANV